MATPLNRAPADSKSIPDRQSRPAVEEVLLQSSARDKATVSLGHSQAAMSNSELTKAPWATMSFLLIPFTCPFLIIASVS